MAKYAQRESGERIIGFTNNPNQLTDTTPVDENSQEWIDYINSGSDTENQKLINELERSVTSRRLREANLTTEGKAWLQDIDDQIAALRG